MKKKLYIHMCEWTNELNVTSYKSKHQGPLLREVMVDLPDDLIPDEKELKRMMYLYQLDAAQRIVEDKRDELTKAEDIVKNMLAIEHTPEQE